MVEDRHIGGLEVRTHERTRPDPLQIQADEDNLAMIENKNMAMGGAANPRDEATGEDFTHLMSHLRFAMTPTFTEIPTIGLASWRKHVRLHLDRLVASRRPGPTGLSEVVEAASMAEKILGM